MSEPVQSGLSLMGIGLLLVIWGAVLNIRQTSPLSGLAATFIQAFYWPMIVLAVWMWVRRDRWVRHT